MVLNNRNFLFVRYYTGTLGGVVCGRCGFGLCRSVQVDVLWGHSAGVAAGDLALFVGALQVRKHPRTTKRTQRRNQTGVSQLLIADI